MKVLPIKHAPTLFLKVVLVVIGGTVTVLCAILFPMIYRELQRLSQFTGFFVLCLFAFYATLIPFLFALVQAFKILQYIDHHHAFSEASINALSTIKYCAIAMSILYAIFLPLVILLAELDDAPGLGGLGMILTGAPLIVATFAAVLQKLVRSALDLQMENDLTV